MKDKDYTARNLREDEERLRRWMPHFPLPRLWPLLVVMVVGYALIAVAAWWWFARIR